jgi:hypothetical protein
MRFHRSFASAAALDPTLHSKIGAEAAPGSEQLTSHLKILSVGIIS